MNSRQMNTFMQVVEKGNLSEAAKELNITQPAVTGIIKKMESDFGTELFIRNGKSLLPNNQGRLLYKMIKEILFTESLAQISLENHRKTSKFITVDVDSYNDYFFSVISEFSRTHPEYCFIYKSKSFAGGAEPFTSADFVFTYNHMVNSKNKISIDIQDKLYAVLPNNHALSSRKKISLYELREEFFIFLKGAKHEEYEPCYQECICAGFTPKISLIVDVPAAKYSAVSAGCGIGLSYNTKLKLAASTCNCVLVECTDIQNRQTLCLTWRDDLNEDARFFLEWLKQYRLSRCKD